jgi:hypothetical protein
VTNSRSGGSADLVKLRAANHGNPLQLLDKLGTMLNQHFINPHSQVHERFDVHP